MDTREKLRLFNSLQDARFAECDTELLKKKDPQNEVLNSTTASSRKHLEVLYALLDIVPGSEIKKARTIALKKTEAEKEAREEAAKNAKKSNKAKKAAEKKAAEKEAAEKKAAEKEAAEKEASEKEAAEKEATDKEAADKEAAEKEVLEQSEKENNKNPDEDKTGPVKKK